MKGQHGCMYPRHTRGGICREIPGGCVTLKKRGERGESEGDRERAGDGGERNRREETMPFQESKLGSSPHYGAILYYMKLTRTDILK
jgi:hypothetical protein